MLIKNSSILRPTDKMKNSLVTATASLLLPRNMNFNDIMKDSTLECYFNNPDGFISIFEGENKKVTAQYRNYHTLMVPNFKIVCLDDRDENGTIAPFHKTANFNYKTRLKYLSSNCIRTFKMISRIIK